MKSDLSNTADIDIFCYLLSSLGLYIEVKDDKLLVVMFVLIVPTNFLIRFPEKDIISKNCYISLFEIIRELLHNNKHAANGSLLCWFCLVLFQWLFLSGRMSALCAWPSPRTLDVTCLTWSLHYLLSSTMLPSRCATTWNAWLASSQKPSWNCVLKRCRLFHRSSSSSHVCRSQDAKRDSSTAAQSTGKQTSLSSLPQLTLTAFITFVTCHMKRTRTISVNCDPDFLRQHDIKSKYN